MGLTPKPPRRDDYVRHSRKITRGARWKTLRAAVLERDSYACRACGTRRARLEIDHIEPVRNRPDLAWSPGNLQALCPACHTRKTRVECGHRPASPDRARWAQAVADLAEPTTKQNGDTNA